ncbi:hypothetical protein SNEBB_010262 [Seison nebaliae]|nr:hypothetical protein SNEBB_010262 [Seison nebaliae]
MKLNLSNRTISLNNHTNLTGHIFCGNRRYNSQMWNLVIIIYALLMVAISSVVLARFSWLEEGDDDDEDDNDAEDGDKKNNSINGGSNDGLNDDGRWMKNNVSPGNLTLSQ